MNFPARRGGDTRQQKSTGRRHLTGGPCVKCLGRRRGGQQLYGTRNIARFLEIPVDKCQRLIAEWQLARISDAGSDNALCS
jgi:hypothetical protein